MSVKYETLRTMFGESAEKKVEEHEIVVEEDEKEELQFSPNEEEPSTNVGPTETENEQVIEQNLPNEVVESSELCKETELHVFLEKQHQALAALDRQIVLLNQKVTAIDASLEQIKQVPSKECSASSLVDKLEELRQASVRQEKANIDILRDSKNFQTSVREQMQRELDRYHKMHAETANAPILTDIANLYIMSCKAISFLTDAKERKNISEIVLEGLLEILEEQGVTVNSTHAGGKRSIKTCKTRKTIPTGDSRLHGLVAESVNPSFMMGNQVLIKECIDTYVYDASLALSKDDSKVPIEESDVNQDESSATTDVASLEPARDISDETLTGDDLLEGDESKDEALLESSTCIDDGAIETDILTKCNE